MSDPIRVFVGTEPKTEVAFRVLEHSIRRHTSGPVEVVPMIGAGWEYPLDGITVGTGFSLRRWMIPAACSWQGRAVYLDADMLVFRDLRDLWEKPDRTPGPRPDCSTVWCTYQPDKHYKEPAPQTSVMVIDCARAFDHWGFHIGKVLDHLRKNPSKEAYARFMHATWLGCPPVEVPNHWNHLNVWQPQATRLLHYTKEPEQPWYKPDHRLADLWRMALVAAIKDGAVPKAVLEAALAAWGKKVDWRNTNGMHPMYAKYLKLYEQV